MTDHRPTLYDQLGGAPGIRALVDRFYDLVEIRPDTARLRDMHMRGHGLTHAREAQTDFLSGFTGGPRLYAERHGHMDLRLIHEHLEITMADAEGWLAAMAEALATTALDAPAQTRFLEILRRNCLRLVNAA